MRAGEEKYRVGKWKKNEEEEADGRNTRAEGTGSRSDLPDENVWGTSVTSPRTFGELPRIFPADIEAAQPGPASEHLGRIAHRSQHRN